MLPNAVDSLLVLAGYMGKEMAPRIDDAYTSSMTALVSGLLLMISHEHEHAAENFVRENDAIRALFARWGERPGDEALRERIGALAMQRSDSHQLSALRAQNDALREALIAFHSHIESVEDAWASEADREVWDLLAASREREKIEHVLDLFNSPG